MGVFVAIVCGKPGVLFRIGAVNLCLYYGHRLLVPKMAAGGGCGDVDRSDALAMARG